VRMNGFVLGRAVRSNEIVRGETKSQESWERRGTLKSIWTDGGRQKKIIEPWWIKNRKSAGKGKKEG